MFKKPKNLLWNDLSFAFYQRNFSKQYVSATDQIATRQGCILCYTHKDKHYYAEASPLQHHSKESLADIKQSLQNKDEVNLPNALAWAYSVLDLQKNVVSKPSFTSSNLENKENSVLLPAYSYC